MEPNNIELEPEARVAVPRIDEKEVHANCLKKWLRKELSSIDMFVREYRDITHLTWPRGQSEKYHKNEESYPKTFLWLQSYINLNSVVYIATW